MSRASDYDTGNKHHATIDCITCHRKTFFIDQICGWCRSTVPRHIPFKQVKRYVLRIKNGKGYATK